MHFRYTLPAALIAALSIAAVAAAAAPYYVGVDLGDIGGDYSRALALNNNGEVTGIAKTPGANEYYAFLYSNGTMENLGSLGGNRSEGWGINDDGLVVGKTYTGTTPSQIAFLYDGTMNGLGVLPDGTSSFAYGINDAGYVVGWSTVDGRTHGFLYTPEDGMIDLGSLAGETQPPTQTAGCDINATGQITGYSNNGPDNGYEIHAFLYENGSMQDLGTLGGSLSQGYAINDDGYMVGYSMLDSASGGHDRAFIAHIDNGEVVMQELGTLGGDDSEALDINNEGFVVGNAHNDDNKDRAFVYTEDAMYNLNERIDPSLSWTLGSAEGINDLGQICGTGTLDGKTHGYLLTPALPGDANLDGDVNLLDLTLLGQNWRGSDKQWWEGDFNEDGAVDLLDLTLMGQNWRGSIWGAEAAGASWSEALAMVGLVVPEPSTWTLLVCGLAGMLACAWRKRK